MMQKQHFSEDDLVKRATPREPYKVVLVCCPVCQNTLCDDDDIQENYCPCCGQAIDWTKFNDLKEGNME